MMHWNYIANTYSSVYGMQRHAVTRRWLLKSFILDIESASGNVKGVSIMSFALPVAKL